MYPSPVLPLLLAQSSVYYLRSARIFPIWPGLSSHIHIDITTATGEAALPSPVGLPHSPGEAAHTSAHAAHAAHVAIVLRFKAYPRPTTATRMGDP
ncbi:hypothetical protein A0H81_08348 [Grifola frondosa]|uniref:Uncharacterized protein n=1 Tax=Grifola frondosa TaxID=5627 RepID=A0A1C7M5E9_GRIFR|nr:hypothetical protein A0H81_08348 [Grifola frondosa]